ncbi:MAG: toxin co-regulated pilus biosynthesis Q family protein [Alphaproteobacteria bacterium]|nr:toxin co-regulated pilus biosynthesis Q family protein [Alphaproteobacteria bacterium]
MKHYLEKYIKTNKSALFGILCCVLCATGCMSDQRSYLEREANCKDGICESNQEFTDICVENSAGYSECHDQMAVNYTRTNSDFRAYGERTPRDHRITQAAAGNNISATVVPGIRDEVVEYQPMIDTMAQNSYAMEVEGSQEDEDSAEDADVQNRDWLAEEGQSLKELLTQWSEEAGWRLIWKTNRNYTLSAGAMFRGNFADVASALVRAFARARPAPVATFYKGNRVLVIETMEDENAYD